MIFELFVWWTILLQLSQCCNIWHKGPRIPRKKLQSYYDFIVVGAGSAGSVVASRLSEDPNVNVLLLEAGGREDIRSEIPIAFSTLQKGSKNWNYRTEPQTQSCLGLTNRQSYWTRGKVLGGTSSIGAMVYLRGNRRDYDRWASLGNYGWSFEEVLPYFLKSEGNRSPWTASNTYYHNTRGPLTVSEPSFRTPSSTAFLQGAFENGYPTRDLNGPIQTGAMPTMSEIRNGRRCSASKAFLWPVYHRPNLHVMTHAHVLKVLIDDQKRAYGVLYDHYYKTYEVHASKEVILSGGSINSPQLLMLSGIGPRWHLEELGIPVVVDLPGVGENMQDPVSPGGMIWTLEAPVAINLGYLLSPKNIPKYLLDWAVYGRGILASTGGECQAFIKTPYANQSDDWPDIQIEFATGTPLLDRGLLSKDFQGISDETWNQYYTPVYSSNAFLMMVNIARPKSVGFLRLRSKNPYDHPIIQPNYLSDEDDVRVLIEGIKIAYRIGNSSLFRQFGAKFISTVVPGCEMLTLYTDDYWECLLRHLTITMYHTAGTAKMGVREDPTAVVNPELCVYGVKGLRVIDASIMPYVSSSNTNAPVIMIGEKGSDLIKRTWNLRMY